MSLPLRASALIVSIALGSNGKTSFNTICLLKSTSASSNELLSTILFAFSPNFSPKNSLDTFLVAVPSLNPTYEFM